MITSALTQANSIKTRVKAPTAVWEQAEADAERSSEPTVARIEEGAIWSVEQQKALEEALMKHPATDKVPNMFVPFC